MTIYTGTPRTNKVKNGKLGKLTDGSEKPVFEYKDNGLRYPTQVWKFQRDCLTSNIHPTQKPVALIQQLIKTYTNEGELILDNCMGSGTTAIATILENRRFIGFELDKEYYDKANERIADYYRHEKEN
jgi:site-specific DNA-methyltransferase (adenine-specific)